MAATLGQPARLAERPIRWLPSLDHPVSPRAISGS
jgi:hypothetical protein